ncbi:hypothetical protein AGABI2DRAFT_183756 [Agaricus bisporus var. bisporus H97]|uniref:hypothetical protein n=1 Tax=Agaricus bisporus var. bisporus (strain H97 / ATCC MYA-4626 / FGSC 10389) TaxID=936046 RepID=UPI00029F6716|nr:hypothetical protein AGABI2DRAFT_183756 [Agaricus bisporus var. bisporus H97]EKV48820.1 hypothetical protein AGABI2DRAFT_183756 [Agaricus bisporus var. bisporus H97]
MAEETKPLPPAYGRFLLETFGSGMSINVLYYPQLKVKSVITIASGVWIIMARNTVIPSPSPTFRPVSEPGPCHPKRILVEAGEAVNWEITDAGDGFQHIQWPNDNHYWTVGAPLPGPVILRELIGQPTQLWKFKWVGDF